MTAIRMMLIMTILAGAGLAGCAPAPTVVPTPLPTATTPPAPAPAPTVDPGGLIATRAFDVVAMGAAFVAPDEAKPLMVALRAGSPVPALLPDEARDALTKAVAVQDDALYLVVYVGREPSSGYSVRIVSVAQRVEAGVARLAVMYLIERPDPNKGAAAVITHPYVIARVRGVTVDPANVTFQPQ